MTERSQLKLNAAQCVRCGYVLLSLHVHDFKTHACDPSISFMVDGGNEYVRRGWKVGTLPEDNYIDRSIYWHEAPADVG
jgi:hypothetical protein